MQNSGISFEFRYVRSGDSVQALSVPFLKLPLMKPFFIKKFSILVTLGSHPAQCLLFFLSPQNRLFMQDLWPELFIFSPFYTGKRPL